MYSTVGSRTPILRCNNAENICTMSFRDCVRSISCHAHPKLETRQNHKQVLDQLQLIKLLRQLRYMLGNRIMVILSIQNMLRLLQKLPELFTRLHKWQHMYHTPVDGSRCLHHLLTAPSHQAHKPHPFAWLHHEWHAPHPPASAAGF